MQVAVEVSLTHAQNPKAPRVHERFGAESVAHSSGTLPADRSPLLQLSQRTAIKSRMGPSPTPPSLIGSKNVAERQLHGGQIEPC